MVSNEKPKLINLTPHKISFYDDNDNHIMTLLPCGVWARLVPKVKFVKRIYGIPVVKITYSEVTGLPEPQENTIYIVSQIVAQSLRRPDVMAPDTSPDSVLRNEDGEIIGVKRLVTFI